MDEELKRLHHKIAFWYAVEILGYCITGISIAVLVVLLQQNAG